MLHKAPQANNKYLRFGFYSALEYIKSDVSYNSNIKSSYDTYITLLNNFEDIETLIVELESLASDESEKVANSQILYMILFSTILLILALGLTFLIYIRILNRQIQKIDSIEQVISFIPDLNFSQ